jgi:uncharacterized membrane protein YdjX (TVP38/TMEM64 family)
MTADDLPKGAPSARRIGALIGFAILAAVTLLGFAAPFLPVDAGTQAAAWLAAAHDSALAPPIAILTYALGASIGAPQIALITATVLVFGPWAGLLYCWTGKMIACSIGFALGRRFGAGWVRRHASPAVSDFMDRIAQRGFAVSALIRLVPTIPSVMVNIAAGATPIRYRDFIAGAALGSAPKMALYAFGGHAAMQAVHENSAWAWLALAAIVALWAGLAFVGRRWLAK